MTAANNFSGGAGRREQQVALIRCPGCGKQVSDRARACPRCSLSAPASATDRSEEAAATGRGIWLDVLKVVGFPLYFVFVIVPIALYWIVVLGCVVVGCGLCLMAWQPNPPFHSGVLSGMVGFLLLLVAVSLIVPFALAWGMNATPKEERKAGPGD